MAKKSKMTKFKAAKAWIRMHPRVEIWHKTKLHRVDKRDQYFHIVRIVTRHGSGFITLGKGAKYTYQRAVVAAIESHLGRELDPA